MHRVLRIVEELKKLLLEDFLAKEISIFLCGGASKKQARQGLLSYFTFYNQTRFHQNLDYQTPDMVYYGQPEVKLAA